MLSWCNFYLKNLVLNVLPYVWFLVSFNVKHKNLKFINLFIKKHDLSNKTHIKLG